MAARESAIVDSFQRLFGVGTVVALDESQLLDRFLSLGDESAFEAILRRHGPMVLGVCRHVLDDYHDVEDAFQATFLILVKKAHSIRDGDALGTWLYGVARRVAVRARAKARRTQVRERNGLERFEASAHGCDQTESNEVQRLVHDELERLPYRYRTPLVLCDLEGQTHEDAAAQLCCPVGTIKSRLSRGRERLRQRLARRGMSSPLSLQGPVLSTRAAVELPVQLLHQTTRAAAGLLSKGTFAAGSVTISTCVLTDGVTHTMAVPGSKVALALLLAGTVGAGAIWLASGRKTRIEPNRDSQTNWATNTIGIRGEAQAPAIIAAPQVTPIKNPVPKRGALRIATLRHAGDWDVAPDAVPNLMQFLQAPPVNLDVNIAPKHVFARDPSLVYYPLVTIRGRAPVFFSKEDLEALRRHLDPGGGTLFGDAYLANRNFDASFRKFVEELLPGNPLVPIPNDDELYTNKIGFDLSNVEFTKAAGGRRGFPKLEGVKINSHWAIIYSMHDISGALEGKNGRDCLGYTPDSARKIACNVVIYSLLP